MGAAAVTDDTFEADVLKAEGYVLVDFWAEWCGPCKQIAPALEDLAGEFEGKVRILKLNIDENPAIPSHYGVRGIPTLMVFKNGKVADTRQGAMPKSRMADWLNDLTSA